MAREFFCAYHSLLESLKPYGDAECGRLFRAALIYSATGIEEEFRGNERFIWPTVKMTIDRDKAAYAHKCAVNKENGEKANATERGRTVAKNTERGPNTQEKEKEKEDIKKKLNKKEPPTLEEVRAYVAERNSPVDPVAFWEYYDAGKWKDSKGEPVRNWKQKLITWERGENRGSKRTDDDGRESGKVWNIHYDN